MTAHGVRTHTRVVNGKRQTVTRHYRTTRGGGRDYSKNRRPLLSPRHAGKLAKKAWRARKRHKAAAAGFSLLALLELVSWLTADTLGMLLTAFAMLALAGATGAHATTRSGGGGGGARPPERKPKPKPKPPARPEPRTQPARPGGAKPQPQPQAKGEREPPPAPERQTAAAPGAGGLSDADAAALTQAYSGGDQ